jgi:trehalose 6-phosphate phosphatase
MLDMPLRRDDALFLDFDGTLVEIAEHPERVLLPARLPDLLHATRARLGGALAVVTGRRLDDIDRWLQPFKFAGAGLHGLELRRRPEDRAEHVSDHDVGDAASAVREALGAIEGVWLEDKGRSIAVHFRAAPCAERTCVTEVECIATRFGLRVVVGKRVVELKAPGADKGTAVDALMRVAPFAGRRPIFVGDDVTDEDGFAAAARHGGIGVRIGDGATCASIRLPDVRAALDWLSADRRTMAPARTLSRAWEDVP